VDIDEHGTFQEVAKLPGIYAWRRKLSRWKIRAQGKGGMSGKTRVKIFFAK
jgi:hypothetical protein